MTLEEIERWCHREMAAPDGLPIHQRAVAILDLVRSAKSPPWLADAAEALGEVRPEDGAPLALNWTQVIEAIHELREDQDHWKRRAEAAEYALAAYLCPKCSTCLTPQELSHTMCRKCAEKDMAKKLGAGLLDLPGGGRKRRQAMKTEPPFTETELAAWLKWESATAAVEAAWEAAAAAWGTWVETPEMPDAKWQTAAEAWATWLAAVEAAKTAWVEAAEARAEKMRAKAGGAE